MDYAATIASNALLTLRSIKQHVLEFVKDPKDRDLALCARLVDACHDSQDYIEGRRAFMEKRKPDRSEEHTSELQSLMRISYAVFCLKKKNNKEHTLPDHLRDILNY